jgi:hypothetical protein
VNPANHEQISEYALDISVFADLGTSLPRVDKIDNKYSIALTRDGEETILRFSHTDSSVKEIIGDSVHKFSSFASLLASDRYGSIRSWIDRQKAFLLQDTPDQPAIELSGYLNNALGQYDIGAIDDLLSAPPNGKSTRILLIDGPAGIGKTRFIEDLCKRRLTQYKKTRRPPILHVQSRGRTLSYLSDLIAYNLQRLRLDVTFDQVPILSKYGLVVVAIDGFDELADPEGYGMAWSQVSDLVSTIRGDGTLILAGRETFIGRERLLKDVSSIRLDIDDTNVYTLIPPSKTEALRFLRHSGWTSGQCSAVESLLEPNSLALRPFFLKTLADKAVSFNIEESNSGNIITILIDALLVREVAKFGEAVELELNISERDEYIRSLMRETARDMADNTTTAISDSTLSFLVDVALPKAVTDSTNRLLKQRAQVIAFLTNDDRAGFRRFYHEKFYEYFLAVEIVESVSRGQAIKPIARNLLASSFLETFGSLLTGGIPVDSAQIFLRAAIELARSYVALDRTKRNLTGLLIACLGIADLVDQFSLDGLEADEVRFTGTAAPASLRNLVISQFDCRGGDISQLNFDNCSIFTFIGDSATLLPRSFSMPALIQDVSKDRLQISDPAAILEWVRSHYLDQIEELDDLIPAEYLNHPAVRTLQKACRMKQYWLRNGDDKYSSRILTDKYWPLIENILAESNLLTVEMRQASGRDGRFLHIRKIEEIIDKNRNDKEVARLYELLVTKIRQL